MQRVSVLFPTPLGTFDYLSAESVLCGQWVTAPFGRKKVRGVVWDAPPDSRFPDSKLKPIEGVLEDIPIFPKESVHFINWVSRYTLSPLGAVLKMALIPDMEKQSAHPIQFEKPNPSFCSLTFSKAQQKAIDALTEETQKGFGVSLLDGVTGSGKTEVYFEIMAQVLQKTGQILVLLPEIILTSAWLDRFEKRFGVRPAVWHSSMTVKQRRDTWQAVMSGEARVLVGARSALFLPFLNLKLIVVDEEHDSSFKQEEGVLYHARDMAIVRARIADCPIVLASATPSVETYCNALSGRYKHVTLPERYAHASLPNIQIVDMRQKEKGPVRFVSPVLSERLKETLDKKEQALLFLNRRGYAPLILCRACGERIKCPYCSAWLVEHRKKGYMQCHHCGYTKPIPTCCPTCQETDSLISCGPGVERVYEEVQELFPTARLEMITSETVSNPKEFQGVLERVSQGETDILIGTQILAKGHHFANLTLVGVIDADMGLAGGDLRAGERTFQLLHQVMGRAGREQKQGLAILQSYHPENMIIQALKENDRDRFLKEEIASRQLLTMPPFGKLASLIVSGKDQEKTYQTAKEIARQSPFMTGLDVLGPVPAPLSLLRGKYRYRLLVKADKSLKLQPILVAWLKKVVIPSSVELRLDIDPYSFF